MSEQTARRRFLIRGGALLAAGLAGPTALAAATQPPPVSPVEDLMREHGLLARVILVYGELRGRLTSGRSFPPETLSGATQVIRTFIQDYQEKLEEEFIFPRFENVGHEAELVKTLRLQHEAGRGLIVLIRGATAKETLEDGRGKRELAGWMNGFSRMYRPHKAREDTVLFPALHSLLSASEYDALGEQFERREHELFGEGGFEKMVEKVAEIEKALNLNELSTFTPALRAKGAGAA